MLPVEDPGERPPSRGVDGTVQSIPINSCRYRCPILLIERAARAGKTYLFFRAQTPGAAMAFVYIRWPYGTTVETCAFPKEGIRRGRCGRCLEGLGGFGPEGRCTGCPECRYCKKKIADGTCVRMYHPVPFGLPSWILSS